MNPRINSTLNPRINSSYGGPFTYDLDLRQTSIIVRASDNVLLRFSSNLDFEGICALDQSGGYAVFDLQNDWIEHWVDDGQGGFVRFALDGEWIGFVT